MSKIGTSRIRRLLREKHAKDLTVEECKNGPTWTAAHRRFDMWVLKRTWSPITMIGYEIKEGRGDFLRDEKWRDYLPLCHQLYFVCPTGLIEKEELPNSVGLLWTNKTGSRLYTKRKAPRREIDLPVKLLLYILMSRAQIDEEPSASKYKYWCHWIDQRREQRALGERVSRKVAEEVRRARKDAAAAANRLRDYDSFREKLKAHGINPDGERWVLRQAAADILRDQDKELIMRVRGLSRSLEKLAKEMEAKP